jgi:hypothetical protein
MRHAERKLKEAQRRLARSERSVSYWSRVLSGLKHARMRAIQAPLWPEEESGGRKQGKDLETGDNKI